MDASSLEDAACRRARDLRLMTVDEVASFLGVTLDDGTKGREWLLTGVAAPETAVLEDIVFAQDEASLALALQSSAGLILAEESLRREHVATAGTSGADRVLWVRHARLAFARAGERLRPARKESQIDASATISATAKLGECVRIGPGVVIEEGVVIGDKCELAARVVVHAGTLLGARVVVKAGAILGSAGFGFVRDSGAGAYVPFPQQGLLVIEDDVWIGANSTIDRGALGETRIGQGTKIDNLVHIAHNCRIGRDVVIAAQTGIAGSSVVGDGAVIAGQAGIADHVRIGEGVVVGAKAGVPSNKKLQGVGQIFWGIPARPIQQYLRELAWLRRLSEKKEPSRKKESSG